MILKRKHNIVVNGNEKLQRFWAWLIVERDGVILVLWDWGVVVEHIGYL